MKRQVGLFTYIKREVFGTNNNLFAIAWLTAVVLIVGLGLYAGSPSRSFLGIANNQESDINFEESTEVRKIHVIPGQKVKKGELLLEVLVAGKPDRYLFSEKAGVIGSVNYKPGEKVPAYGPILTISPESPTQVTGFIQEAMSSRAEVGDYVKIRPMSNADIEVEGRIISFGSRIIEIPSRLSTGLVSQTIYGREVIIQLPAKNKLLAGEKVVISPRSKSFIGLTTASAEIKLSPKAELEGGLIVVPPSIAKSSSFEPSGLVYMPELKKYLVVSDDTNKARSPFLFLMTEEGEVETSYLTIPGVEEISDIESISSDGKHIYVMSSLSLTHNGHFKDRQNYLIRFEMDGLRFKSVEKILLGKILRDSLKASFDPQLRKIVSLGLDHIDVEAQALKGNDLYLVLKTPVLESGGSMILKISNLEALFEGDPLAKIEVDSVIEFGSLASKYQQQVTDLAFVKNTLVVTTTCLGKKCGGVWKIESKAKKAELVKFFLKLQPEGVAYNSEKNSLMVTFDQGSDPPMFTVLKF
jgi:hypothetical protein